MSKAKKLDITFDKLIEIAKALNENTIANKTRAKEERIGTDSFIRRFGIARKDFSETIKDTPITYNPSTFLYVIPDEYLGNTKVLPKEELLSITKVLPLEVKENKQVFQCNTKVIPKESNTSIAIKKELIEVVKNTIDMEYPELQKIIEWFKKEQGKNQVIELPEADMNHPKLKGEIISKSFKTYKAVLDEFVEFSKNRKETQKDLVALALIEFMEKYKR